jgi:hypothetical protein
MGDAGKDALRLDFDRRLKLESHGTKLLWYCCQCGGRSTDYEVKREIPV